MGVANTSHVTVTNTLTGSFTKAAWVKLGINPGNSYNIISNGTVQTSNSDFFWVTNNVVGGSANYSLKAGPQTT